MIRQWELRFYREGDEKEIVRLLNLALPESNYTLARWLWEYKNNPYGFLTIVAEHEGRVVGHMGLFFLELQVGDMVIKGSQACDLAVHPDFRNQGMFLAMGKTLLNEAGEQGVPVTYGFPNRPAYFGHIKYGWFDAARVPVLRCPYHVYNIFEGECAKHPRLKLLNHIVKNCSKRVDYLASKLRERQPSSISNLVIKEVRMIDPRFDNLWKRMSGNYGVAVVRNRKYLNWRFLEKPDARYRVFAAEKSDDILGYIIVSADVSKYWKVGYIDDVLGENLDVVRNLVALALRFFRERGIDMAECWLLQQTFWYKALIEKGFIPMHILNPAEKKRFIVRVNSPSFLEVYKGAKKGWYLTYSDSDYAGGRLSIT